MSACDEREPIAGKKRVLEKGRRQMLRAAIVEHRHDTAGRELRLSRFSLDEFRFGACQHGVSPDRPHPLRSGPHDSGRHALQTIQVFTRAIGRDS